ncbi:hypothetical protein BDK51DRAFT_36509 [Blyttiomyces helicus]|uniref:Uncharacterized protein n=1 Tax=Blyttiomyces helicus TaxID=388810 RepID=A0A4P9WHR0_9FUNG|nr:hypothetical protein BDK51DRAFT_36509 [Blyttiomyces helicus]|eukprot:RKO90650.1 hypothetical protein BDK51DRAFT_36509 [Blyttiomyces helicus]
MITCSIPLHTADLRNKVKGRERGDLVRWQEELGRYLFSVPSYYRPHLNRAFDIAHWTQYWPAQLTRNGSVWVESVARSLARALPDFDQLNQARKQKKELESRTTATVAKSTTPRANPYDVPRGDVLSALADGRAAFKQGLSAQTGKKPPRLSQEEQDRLHALPISEMGDYAASLSTPTFRDPLEDDATALARQRNTFGNPYKPTSSGGVSSIDEADEASTLERPSVAPGVANRPSRSLRRGSVASTTSGTTTSSTGSRWRAESVPRLTRTPPVLVPPPASATWDDVRSGRLDVGALRRAAGDRWREVVSRDDGGSGSVAGSILGGRRSPRRDSGGSSVRASSTPPLDSDQNREVIHAWQSGVPGVAVGIFRDEDGANAVLPHELPGSGNGVPEDTGMEENESPFPSAMLPQNQLPLPYASPPPVPLPRAAPDVPYKHPTPVLPVKREFDDISAGDPALPSTSSAPTNPSSSSRSDSNARSVFARGNDGERIIPTPNGTGIAGAMDRHDQQPWGRWSVYADVRNRIQTLVNAYGKEALSSEHVLSQTIETVASTKWLSTSLKLKLLKLAKKMALDNGKVLAADAAMRLVGELSAAGP